MLKIRSVPLLLYSYIAAELLAPFFASFLILYSIFFLVRLTPLLQIVLELGIGLTDFIRLSCYIFPYMLLYVIPMASMTGVIIGFTRLTADREILALKSCGVSLKQMLPPVMITAMAISVLTGYFSVRLIPAGEVSMRQLMFRLAKHKIEKGLEEKTFTEALGDLVVYVDQTDDNDVWHGVYVSDMRGGEQPTITMAETGHMEAQIQKMLVTIVLNNGTMHNIDGRDNQIVKFNRYQLQIPLNASTKMNGKDIAKIGRGSMSQRQLLDAAQEHGKNTKKGVSYLTEYHHRLVLPVGCFILSLLGMPLGMQAGPGRRAAGIPLGLGFFVLYYVAFTTFRILCEDMVLNVTFGMWMPNILFFVMMLFVFWRVEQEKPILPETIQNIVVDLYDRLVLPVKHFFDAYSRRMLEKGVSTISSQQAVTSLFIHADPRENIFHFPECEDYDCEHCTIEFKNAVVARKAGFEPCRFCKTLQEKEETRDQ